MGTLKIHLTYSFNVFACEYVFTSVSVYYVLCILLGTEAKMKNEPYNT